MLTLETCDFFSRELPKNERKSSFCKVMCKLDVALVLFRFQTSEVLKISLTTFLSC